MAHPNPDAFGGVQNGAMPSAHPPAQQAMFSRPFTLREALPYSPFTSVIPFESGENYPSSSIYWDYN